MDRNWDDLVATAKQRGLSLPYATMTKADYARRDLVALLGNAYLQQHAIDLNKEHGLRMRLSLESPMLCANYKDLRAAERRLVKPPQWVAEEKFNGDRMLITYHPDEGFRFFSRNISVVTFLPLEYTDKIVLWSKHNKSSMGSDWKQVYPIPFMLDSEILATSKHVDTSVCRRTGGKSATELNAVNAIIGLDAAAAVEMQLKQCKLRFVCFDVMYHGDDEVMPLPLRQRRHVLEQLLGQLEPNHNMTLSRWLSGDFDSLFADIVAVGGEGLVLKNLDKPYMASDKRYRDVQLKMKRSHGKISGDDIDAYVIGYVDANPGSCHARDGLIGALKLAVRLRKSNGTESEHWIATVGAIPLALRRQMSVAGGNGPALAAAFYGRVLAIDGQGTSAKARRFTHAKADWTRGFRDDKSAHECVLDESYLDAQIL